MKQVLFFIFANVLFSISIFAQNTTNTSINKETKMKEVFDFVKKCETYYIATVDGNKPRVRPFGTIHIFDGNLYIQTGKKKDVAKQMKDNPNIEICAFNGSEWIRIQAVVNEDDRREAKQSMLDAYPSLKTMYSADDDNTLLLYLTDVTAVIYSFSADTKTIKF